MLKTIRGFKDFIMRGNVIDLSVGIVIGAAFTALVTAVTKSSSSRSSACVQRRQRTLRYLDDQRGPVRLGRSRSTRRSRL